MTGAQPRFVFSHLRFPHFATLARLLDHACCVWRRLSCPYALLAACILIPLLPAAPPCCLLCPLLPALPPAACPALLLPLPAGCPTAAIPMGAFFLRAAEQIEGSSVVVLPAKDIMCRYPTMVGSNFLLHVYLSNSTSDNPFGVEALRVDGPGASTSADRSGLIFVLDKDNKTKVPMLNPLAKHIDLTRLREHFEDAAAKATSQGQPNLAVACTHLTTGLARLDASALHGTCFRRVVEGAAKKVVASLAHVT
jgi:hypothetical protein